LLDSRLTSGGPNRDGALDVESSTQLVKALNRLAIQAAIGSPRQTSLRCNTVLPKLEEQSSHTGSPQAIAPHGKITLPAEVTARHLRFVATHSQVSHFLGSNQF